MMRKKNIGILFIGLSLLVASLSRSMVSVEEAIYRAHGIDFSNSLHAAITIPDILTIVVLIMGFILYFKRKKEDWF